MPKDPSVYVTPKTSKSLNNSKRYEQNSNRGSLCSRDSGKRPRPFDSKKSGQLYLEMNYNQNLQDYLQELHTPPGQRTKGKNDFDIGNTVGKRKETPIKLDKSSTNDHEKVSTVSSVYSNNNRRNLEPVLRKTPQRPPTGLPFPTPLHKKHLKSTNSISYYDLDRKRNCQTLRSEQSTDGPALDTHPSYNSENQHNPSPPPISPLHPSKNITEPFNHKRSQIFSNISHSSPDPPSDAYSSSTSNCLFSRLQKDETSKTYPLEASEREIPRFAQELKREEDLLEKKIKELKKNKAKLRFKYMKHRELVEKGCFGLSRFVLGKEMGGLRWGMEGLVGGWQRERVLGGCADELFRMNAKKKAVGGLQWNRRSRKKNFLVYRNFCRLIVPIVQGGIGIWEMEFWSGLKKGVAGGKKRARRGSYVKTEANSIQEVKIEDEQETSRDFSENIRATQGSEARMGLNKNIFSMDERFVTIITNEGQENVSQMSIGHLSQKYVDAEGRKRGRRTLAGESEAGKKLSLEQIQTIGSQGSTRKS